MWEAVVVGLLAVSAVLWVVWLVRSLLGRSQRGWGVGRYNRVGLPEVALAVVSMMGLAWLWTRLLAGAVESETLGPSVAGGLAGLMSCLLILGILGWKAPNRLGSLGLKAKGLKSHLGWGTLLAVAVWPIAVLVLAPASFWVIEKACRWLWDLSYTQQAHALMREIGEAGTSEKIMVVLLAVVVAPLTEEILFRGLLQGALAGALKSRWTAIIASAAVFALFHLAARENAAVGEASLARVETIPALFVLGVVLGYAYEKSGSLYRPMVIHMVFNGLTLLIAWWQLT